MNHLFLHFSFPHLCRWGIPLCSLKLRNFGCTTAQVIIFPSVKLLYNFWMILTAGWDLDDHTLPHQVQPTWQIATLTSLCILDLVSRDKRLLKNSSINYDRDYENSYACFCSIMFQLLIFWSNFSSQPKLPLQLDPGPECRKNQLLSRFTFCVLMRRTKSSPPTFSYRMEVSLAKK